MKLTLDEEEIQAVYDAAEMLLEGFVSRDVVLVRDERERTETIRRVARSIADGVVRSLYREPDITDLGVSVEWANPNGGNSSER